MRERLALLPLLAIGLTAASKAADKDETGQVQIIAEGRPVTLRFSEDGKLLQEGPKPSVSGSTDSGRNGYNLGQRTDQFAAAADTTYLGVEADEVPEVLQHQLKLKPLGSGLVINAVVPGSPAEKAGLQKYDILQKLDDQILFNVAQLSSLVHSMKSGDQVKLSVIRTGEPQTLNATLSKQTGERFFEHLPIQGQRHTSDVTEQQKKEPPLRGSASEPDKNAEEQGHQVKRPPGWPGNLGRPINPDQADQKESENGHHDDDH